MLALLYESALRQRRDSRASILGAGASLDRSISDADHASRIVVCGFYAGARSVQQVKTQ
jgi:hypothetical protein